MKGYPMRLPESRGALCDNLFGLLRRDDFDHPDAFEAARLAAQRALDGCEDIVRNDDLQCALFVLYELHYRGVEEVDDRWEWNPHLIALRSTIEAAFEAQLRTLVPLPVRPEPNREAVADALFRLTAEDGGPSLSRYVANSATDDQLHEFLIQRSIYQLKEADPHSWAIPRLDGPPKAALVEIEADEYGGGRPDRMHAVIFAGTMRGLGLDPRYGAYTDSVPAVTLASANMMSLFGLHRRLRGAIVGHLAAFEMTSSIPNRFYGNGFRRHGYDDTVTWYFDEHVEADAVHEQIAGRDLAGGLVEAEPELLDDVLFGAAACLTVDGLVGEHILGAWERNASSLRHSPVLAA
jgi:hypothetical protein